MMKRFLLLQRRRLIASTRPAPLPPACKREADRAADAARVAAKIGAGNVRRLTALAVSLLLLAGCRSYTVTTPSGAEYSASVFASDTEFGTLRYVVDPESGAVVLEVGDFTGDAETQALADAIASAIIRARSVPGAP